MSHLAACDTLFVPQAATPVPEVAPKTAKAGTACATYGAKRAQTGTAFIGYTSYINSIKSMIYRKLI
ncbi:hypothetical protein GCM10017655_30470 [Pseudomonas turukhanskensis]|uniref:Uncharacterized protein n=1 Tax=Pseudomonas turukhanskensis TaxID=1806536 RepID=A0A9W6K5N7_9PSED|nr:hypothetical protein GCM10017655_30470 [Pseudomonas turukhanskensis]